MGPTWQLADLFETVADAVGEREALVCGRRRLSYRDLDERATRLAHWLLAQGVGVADHIGLHLHNGVEYLEGMLAAFKLRAVPINVNYRYVADELRYLFDDADVTAVIHEPDFSDVITDIRPQLPRLHTTLASGDEYEAALASVAPERDGLPGGRSPDDRYVLYTGGTTGMPKGVIWRHEDIFFAAMGGFGRVSASAEEDDISSPAVLAERARGGRTRCLPACPFIHGTAHWMAFSALFAGGTVVVDPEPRFDPDRVWGLVERERVNYLVIVGDAFARPLVDAVEANPDAWDLSGLSVILSGGAILSPSLKDALLAALPGTIVVDGFGASETGGQGQMVAVEGSSARNPRFRMGPDTAVLDEQDKPLAPGSDKVGRLARHGRIPIGYYKDPTRTDATFPVIDGRRWSIPGDYATIGPDGTITLLGRGSVSINTGGEKVYPEEVEAVLKGHPSVFDAVVVGVEDRRWGQRVTAVVQPRDRDHLPVDDLDAHLRTHLASYKVPRSFVVVERIERSPSGKPDYRWARTVAATVASESS